VKAIIVAAGRGRRLGPETAEIPKCMVEVGGRPILHRQLAALVAAGADQIVVVRGYLGERIAPPAEGPPLPLRFIENPEWERNNILASLMYAEGEMEEGFLFTYSDIVFATEHVRRLAAPSASAPVTLVVDRRWSDAYAGRIQHPVSEAELTKVTETTVGPRVDKVGKRVVTPADTSGEFIGLARFSPDGARALRQVWAEALARGLSHPFGQAASLSQAYLSDGLNDMAARGVALVPLFIDGRWREIDTEEDLARAHPVVNGWDAGD
jgi:choline kinase